MYKHILAPIDGSAASNRALEEAINLAKALQAQLRLIHVIDKAAIIGWISAGSVVDILHKTGQQVIDQGAARVREAGLKVETALIEGQQHVADAIINDAKHWTADVIVIGTHGRRGARHLVLGSVADGVARSATVPVLLIREK